MKNLLIINFLLSLLFSSQVIGEEIQINYKKLFAEIFAKHIVQDPHKYDSLVEDPFLKVRDSIYYNPKDFKDLYLDILNQKNSIQVFKKREELLSNKKILKKLMKGEVTKPKGKEWEGTAAFNFYESLDRQFKEKNHREGNYFKTEVGKLSLKALENTIFIILPGFGNHIISHMALPDLLKDINLYYGRKRFRPYKQVGLIPSFMDYKEYYTSNNGKKIGFDILQPMGMEIGLSIGRHATNSQKLRKWINELPKEYKDKEIVFLGYSKGTTTGLEIIKDFEDIRKRVRAVIGLGGPYQGSVNAENIQRRLFKMSPGGTKESFFSWVKKIPSNEMVATIVLKLAQTFAKDYPIIETLLSSITNLKSEHFNILKAHVEFLLGGDLKEVINGFYEEAQNHMMTWNMRHFNDKTFNHPISFFSLSFLTNVNDFFVQGPIFENGKKYPPNLVPQLSVNGGIDFESFSPDNLVQRLTSVDTFELTPAGALDTQVSWADSKPIVFDPTPLSYSFNDKELKEFYIDKKNWKFLFGNNRIPFEDLKNIPRNQFFKKESFKNAKFYDLGEARCSHWSCMFRQVLKLPNLPIEWGHNHAFPHRSMTKALIETYSIHLLLKKKASEQ